MKFDLKRNTRSTGGERISSKLRPPASFDPPFALLQAPEASNRKHVDMKSCSRIFHSSSTLFKKSGRRHTTITNPPP